MHRRAKSRSAEQGINRTELKRVLEHIVSSTPPSDLFELYYWVQEPSLLKIIRQLAAMPDEDREAIESFFALAQDLAVVARWDRGDRLVLEAKQLRETFSRLQCSVEDDDLESTERKLN